MQISPAALNTQTFTAPAIQGPMRPSNLLASVFPVDKEYGWLSRVKAALEKQFVDGMSGYHALHITLTPSKCHSTCSNQHTTAPVSQQHTLRGNDKTFHGRHLCSRSEHMNPGQVPVVGADQPLFAL